MQVQKIIVEALADKEMGAEGEDRQLIQKRGTEVRRPICVSCACRVCALPFPCSPIAATSCPLSAGDHCVASVF